MFYEGDLQSGITLAVREAKSVICFVRDDAQESAQWEKEYFDDEIAQLVKDNAVTLRLTAGTQEAGFLTSICPVNTFPTVVVIKNGMIQEYIVAGASKDDFQKRLKAVLVPNTSNPTAPVQSTPQNAAANTTTPPADTSNVSPAANPPAQPDPPAQPQTQDTERRNRESIRAGKRPVETSDESASAAERFKRDLQEWREQQRRLEQQRKEERERIRNQIKQDREERKRREAEENARADSHGVTQASRPSGSSPAKPQQYRLQVRLFDGSSVRTSFPPSATVRGDVRPWLDAQRSDGNRPYTLKHVLTPLPSHTISVAEEERTLEELGLGPTANLVMVPVHAYTEAYASSSSSSLPGRAISAGYNLVSGVVGTVAGLVGSFLEYGPASSDTAVSDNSSQQPVNNTKAPRPAAASSSRGINIRTLRDQREEQDSNQFYNGNQLNFEPRRDDDRDRKND